ncbi:hypothetical protein AN217_12970 [Streptomyces qinglanensis]|uniref:DUF397 domain-containing protein n=1 Tax=Streptomyces qinglanensis TaxID=943816 RepID=A0A1E7K3S4_9ACTN|nr:DUF397 domain-containing protein [Streptomyces qinglanensis]OEU98573.1 hypothetical protein AN217_12970 [Streptomyces qinglanensis]OEV26796.1 hypothetical protein AN220_07310 [Streptomyces nanshensis]
MIADKRTAAELPLAWCRSSYSGDGGGNCVEVAHTGSAVHVRDFKTDGPRLTLARSGWATFVASLTR